MNLFIKSLLMICVVALSCLTSCKEEDPKNSLVSSRDLLEFSSEGGTINLILQTDAEEWRIQNLTDWITLSQTIGSESSVTIEVTVSSRTPEARSGTLKIIAGNAELEIMVTQAASEFLYSSSSNYTTITFKKGGNNVTINLYTDAPDWEVSTDADWIQFNMQTGSGDAEIIATAEGNTTGLLREGTISITAPYMPAIEIPISQIGEYYPSYNTSPLSPDATGMASTAEELAAKMTLGINIGNTLEAIGGETAWGNPMVTEAYVDAVKNLGFTTIRIPCSFDQYSNIQTAEIQAAWLNRVRAVVQLCVDKDLYTVLNIHWDGGWLENNVTPAKQEENNAKQKAFWEQIATHLRDFDERLIFAGSNEPNVENAAQMSVLLSYHQTFIDAVRSTGGRNSYRVLVFQGASTDIQKTKDLLNTFPVDEVPDRLMAELHYYTPYQFCLMAEDADWGKVFYYWGEGYHSTTNTDRNATWGEEAEMDRLFGISGAQFVSKGYPVILGEFGAYKRSNIPEQELHNASVEYFNETVVRTAREHGLIPYYWDTGGIINRSNGSVKDQGLLDALLQGLEE